MSLFPAATGWIQKPRDPSPEYDDWNDMPGADPHLVLELREPRPESSDIASAQLFSAARRQRCNQPGHRLTKIAPRSVR